MKKHLLSAGLCLAFATAGFAQPANDDCSSAISLTMNSEECLVTTSGTTEDATASAEIESDCGSGTIDDDVWYSFEATGANHNVSLSGIDEDMVLSVYSGTCGSLVEIGCADDPETVNLFGLNVGDTYYCRVWTYSSGDVGNFDICVRSITPPANDECAGALFINGDVTAEVSETATQSLPAIECEGNLSEVSTNDVWFRFDAAESGDLTIEIDQLFMDVVSEFFSGTCGGLIPLGCIDDEPSITITVEAGESYYMRSYGYGGEFGEFDILFSGVALPVEMSNLSGSIRNGLPYLTWYTTKEINNKGFDIQISHDAKSFTTIGFVNSLAVGGNSAENLYYSYTDKGISSTTYYRLRQVDIDGKSAYSNTVTIQGGKDGVGEFDVYPSNTTGKITFVNASENGLIQIFDISGKLQSGVQILNGQNQADLSALPNGLYFVKYISGNSIVTRKVVKM